MPRRKTYIRKSHITPYALFGRTRKRGSSIAYKAGYAMKSDLRRKKGRKR